MARPPTFGGPTAFARSRRDGITGQPERRSRRRSRYVHRDERQGMPTPTTRRHRSLRGRPSRPAGRTWCAQRKTFRGGLSSPRDRDAGDPARTTSAAGDDHAHRAQVRAGHAAIRANRPNPESGKRGEPSPRQSPQAAIGGRTIDVQTRLYRDRPSPKTVSFQPRAWRAGREHHVYLHDAIHEGRPHSP